MPAKTSILLSSDEFGKFFSEYRSHFVSIAFSYIRDMDAARDIVTDSFVYLWERRGELTSETNIKGYIYYCVRNRCNSYLRGKLTHLKATDEMSKSAQWKMQSSLNSLSNDEISQKLFHKEVAAIFREELDRMPRRTREIFEASRNDELTYQEIAEKYDLPVRRVTAEIQSALQILRHALKDFLIVLLVFFIR